MKNPPAPISIDFPLGTKEIVTPCSFFVCGARHGLTAPHVLWDTGAWPTILSQRLVDALGLKPYDKGRVSNAKEYGEQSELYHCDIRLPNGYRFTNVSVSVQPLPGVDALLGLDIIQRGDFLIHHTPTGFRFTFSLPEPPISPDDPCPCGSCIPFSQCHGKGI